MPCSASFPSCSVDHLLPSLEALGDGDLAFYKNGHNELQVLLRLTTTKSICPQGFKMSCPSFLVFVGLFPRRNKTAG